MSFLHPLTLPRSILDPIHGLIRFTDEEVKVINSKLFQRLRRIKQNGLMHFIWPSATHTRFEHSLGVLHVADSMLQALIYNSSAAQGKLANTSAALDGQAIDFSGIETDTLKAVFRITRLAALVHDLGHGPLSHTFDRFAPKQSDIWELVEAEKTLIPLKKIESMIKSAKGDERIHHEIISCIFFYKIWTDLYPEESDFEIPNAVSAAILGRKSFSLIEHNRFKPWIPLINDIVASAPADADRMDYLERDSRSCGVTYGLFDRERLLKSLLCYRSADDEYRLGLKLSGLRAVENFVQARFELFVQVYYHKTNRAIELMLKRVADAAFTEELQVVRSDSLSNLEDGYTLLGDDTFIAFLQGKISLGASKACTNPLITSIANQINDRKLWKRVFDFELCEKEEGTADRDSAKKAQAEAMLTALRKFCTDDDALSDAAGNIEIDTVPPSATKNLNDGAALLRRDANGIYAALSTLKWQKASPIIKALEDDEKGITRIFYLGADQAIAKKLRERAFQIDASRRSSTSGAEGATK